jgi:hypothetical protein
MVLREYLCEKSDSKNTRSADPKIQGRSDTPARLGPIGPTILPPIQAPMMPTIAEVKKPPGMEPGTSLSAKYAQAAATKRKRIKLRIPMMTSKSPLRWIFLNHAANS